MSNKQYWGDRSRQVTRAKMHTKEMQEQFASEIEASIANSYAATVLSFPTSLQKTNDLMRLELWLNDLNTTDALFKHYSPNEKIAVLNFASFVKPGGMFLQGSTAQEESICHDSYLYNVLSAFEDWYKENTVFINDKLFADRMLYCKDIYFFKKNDLSNPISADVITCAAPNIKGAVKIQGLDKINLYLRNSKALDTRIQFILDSAEYNHINTLILGAWGCGVFGQDPVEVASLFKKHLCRTYTYLKKVVFAIPFNANDFNLYGFYKVFQNKELINESLYSN